MNWRKCTDGYGGKLHHATAPDGSREYEVCYNPTPAAWEATYTCAKGGVLIGYSATAAGAKRMCESRETMRTFNIRETIRKHMEG